MKRTILVGELVNDIRAGMTDAELMRKYDLALEGLQGVFKQLLDFRAMRAEEIYGRLPAYADEVILGTSEAVLKNLREQPRHHVDTPISVYDARKSETKGTLRDIHLKGIGIRGIEATVDEISTFVIVPDASLGVEPFMFEAQCRWTGQERGGDVCAGFRITKITGENQEKLEKLIQIVDIDFADPDLPD